MVRKVSTSTMRDGSFPFGNGTGKPTLVRGHLPLKFRLITHTKRLMLQGIGGAESSKERSVGFRGRYVALKDNRCATMGILSLPILVAWYVALHSTERSNTWRT